jgi:hypothetical protein
MKTHVDGDDYTYSSVRYVPAQTGALPLMTELEKMQSEIDALRKDVEHLKLAVHRLLNPDEVQP